MCGFDSRHSDQPRNPCDCGVFFIFQRVQPF
uniref:Deubiquitinase and deneddylase Dub1 n=2 Tax=unclassified Caudoviricetes TaxID=2788787 RepID=A0A8S5VFC2_9CAUD|nr:MAG TPA: Deubiquitinase and deneddylase Dub1 [Siphoviridae sp. ctu1o13]DAG05473.1 MAG TPA: Deubiquitinase and deneddylase Dub1 [Siphoviridae sp. ct1da40]